MYQNLSFLLGTCSSPMHLMVAISLVFCSHFLVIIFSFDISHLDAGSILFMTVLYQCFTGSLIFCFTQLSSIIIADIDDGSVTANARIPRLPTYATDLYKFRWGIAVKVCFMLSYRDYALWWSVTKPNSMQGNHYSH